MFVQLSNDFLNLAHVVRVRFNAGFKNGAQELVAEIEGLVKGEVQILTRYRGADADRLKALLQRQTPAPCAVAPAAVAHPSVSAVRETLHELAIP